MTIRPNIPDLVRELCTYQGETEWLEFKSTDAEPKIIGENISAISNSATIANKPTGYIIWGIQDQNHQIIGTRFNPNSRRIKREDLTHWLSRQLSPSINFQFHTDRVDGKLVVVLVIPSASDQPVRFDGESYIRVGSHTRRLCDFPNKERLLWTKLEEKSFETETAIESIQSEEVLRLVDYRAYFNLSNTPLPPNPEGRLRALEYENFIRSRDDGNWDILNLGYLTLAHDLSYISSFRRKAFRVVSYSGTGRYNASRQKEFSVGYATGFSKIIEYINQISPIDESFNGGVRKQSPRFPDIAVREVIANALIHQDMTLKGTGPLIEIFEDRIEVSNPGVPLIEPELFIPAPPKSRNEALASFLRRIGLCEELGSGWDKIVHEIEIRHLPAPRIEVLNNTTRVTLYAAAPLSKLTSSDRIQAIYLHASLRYTEGGASITNTSVRQRFGISQSNSAKASRFLKEALIAELIIPEDPHASRKFMRYVPYWVRPSE